MANAGDGRAAVYSVIQSEQIHAGLGGINPVGNRDYETKLEPKGGETDKGKEGSEASMTSDGILRHALAIEM